MKGKLLSKCAASLLCAASVLSLLAGCGGEIPGAPSPVASAAAEAAVPDRGQPDRSDLPYLDAIAGYQKEDWTAHWIWTEGCSEDSYAAFRKTFTLDQDVPSATAYISAADKYVLWVNGRLTVLDGSLKRGPTPYDSYYDTVEITGLKQGENTIALLVAFNGRSGDGSIVPVLTDEEGDEYTQAGLIFQMEAGGTMVCSDSSWKAARHTGYRNRVTAGADYPGYTQSSMLAERNVYFDAREDLGDFTAPDYDDSGWESATPVAKAGDLPFGALYSAMIQPVKFDEVTDFANSGDYVGRALTQDTILELELPGNIQFTLCFELEAPAGKTLTFYTDTYTDKQGLANFKDTYVTAEGAQRYENWPWRSGSRLIIEAEAGVTFTRLGYRASGFNGEWAGSFTSSDPGLDQLWQESLNTIAICMRDTYMDCPERERGPYMGDASNQIDAALYSYDQGGLDLTRKAILACVAWTRADGAIPSRAPSVKPQEIPNQSLIFVSSVYHYYLHSGDRETAEAYCRAFLRYLQLVEMEDGLPVYRDGSWTWNDWGERIDTGLLQAGIYYYALNVTRELAGALGITEGTEFLTQRMDEMRENWRAAWYTEEGFRSPDSKYVDDRANALLALSGLAGEEDYPLITDVIMRTYEASPFLEKYVLEALCAMGRTDLALQRMRERYAPMLQDGYDTLWETFDGDTGTVNHGWTAAPLYILSKYAAGVRPVQAGFEEYEIVPSAALDRFRCVVWTPKGELAVELDTTPEGRTLTVNAIDAPGTVVIPEAMGGEITVSGGDSRVDGNRVTLTGAGEYVITIQ